MGRKKLLGSQIKAFFYASERLQRAQQELQNIINMIHSELEIPPEEWGQWRITPDGQWLERVKTAKPKLKIPQGKKEKKDD